MDWYKSKVKYTLYSEMSANEFMAYHKIMALTAQLEKIPSKEQMLKVCHYKTLESLQEKLNRESISLQEVLNKVSIDAQEVVNKRNYWKKIKAQQREKYDDVHEDIHVDSILRLDKIREDKNIYTTDTLVGHLQKEVNEIISPECEDVLNHLNTVAKKSFKPIKSNTKFILGRLKEGYTASQLKSVIDRKAKDNWFIENPKYLRPETLFNATKFQTYVQDDGDTVDRAAKAKEAVREFMARPTKAPEFQ
jgi:uncharacterized phage protein (TIGR02220 family)